MPARYPAKGPTRLHQDAEVDEPLADVQRSLAADARRICERSDRSSGKRGLGQEREQGPVRGSSQAFAHRGGRGTGAALDAGDVPATEIEVAVACQIHEPDVLSFEKLTELTTHRRGEQQKPTLVTVAHRAAKREQLFRETTGDMALLELREQVLLAGLGLDLELEVRRGATADRSSPHADVLHKGQSAQTREIRL